MTMLMTETATFQSESLATYLLNASPQELDELDFGLIGFDKEGLVRQYNAYESKAAGLSLERVLNHPLFTVVAPCMNNFLVAQQFVDAEEAQQPLDITVDYVLTLRMRPIKVKLRLLSAPDAGMRYVLVHRLS